MDNAAAVQVGLALLIGLLVVAAGLLVLGVILASIVRTRDVARMLDGLTATIDTQATLLRDRLRTTRVALHDADRQIAQLEQRIGSQERE